MTMEERFEVERLIMVAIHAHEQEHHKQPPTFDRELTNEELATV